METDKDKLKRILDEINKNKTTSTIKNNVQPNVSTYEKLTEQLMGLHKDHSLLLRQIRSQPISVVEKLLESLDK